MIRISSKIVKKKSNSNRVFDTKIITDLSFKTRFQIMSKNEFDFKKKILQKKNYVYMTNDNEKKLTITNSIMKKINLS